MYQVSIEALLPVTEGLQCICCLKNGVRLESEWNDKKDCYYSHKAECQICGHTSYPAGVKSFLLDHWEETNKGIRDYFKVRGYTPYEDYLKERIKNGELHPC